MTCSKETHGSYTPVAHSTVHEIAAEAVCSGILRGRELSRETLDTAAFDAEEAMALNPGLAEECSRMLGVFVKVRQQLV